METDQVKQAIAGGSAMVPARGAGVKMRACMRVVRSLRML